MIPLLKEELSPTLGLASGQKMGLPGTPVVVPKNLRLLYLGFAFPPGVQALYPELNPAGHPWETQMVRALAAHFDLRSVGVMPLEVPRVLNPDPASGIAHDLLLLEKAPELWHRFQSLERLKAQYRFWCQAGWEPDAILVYNLTPIYNQFLLWLKRQARCPKLLLLLLDSSNLGRQLPWLKRFRHRFKPMVVPDSEMIEQFDACIGLSRTTEKYFEPRQVPFLWMPGGCTPARALTGADLPGTSGPPPAIRFGYFGALAAHAGVMPLVETFLASKIEATLEICGYGKLGESIAQLAQQDRRLRYHGLLPTPAECLRFGRSCDVLVNPRPAGHGNENNFPSKLFEYALTGRAILTTDFAGMRQVLGPAAFYLDAADLAGSLARQLEQLSRTPRLELQRQARRLQRRILSEFSWSRQAEAMAYFIQQQCVVPAKEGACLPISV